MTGGKELSVAFAEDERRTLHLLAAAFRKPDDIELVTQLLNEGVTLKEMAFAYKAQRFSFGRVKAIGGFIVVVGGAIGIMKGYFSWGGQ